MQPIWLDVAGQLDRVGEEVAHLQASIHRFRQLPPEQREDPQIQWEKATVTGSALEKIYSGLESVLEIIGRRFDGELPADSTAYHKALLERMTRENPGIRPPVLTPEAYKELEGFMGFRHRERHSYIMDLDLERVFHFGARVGEAIQATITALDHFAQHYEGPDFQVPTTHPALRGRTGTHDPPRA